MRAGKIVSILAANVTAIGTPDNSNFVFIYFTSDDHKLNVKDSTGTVVSSAALN